MAHSQTVLSRLRRTAPNGGVPNGRFEIITGRFEIIEFCQAYPADFIF
jgi:hypothetical protein